MKKIKTITLFMALCLVTSISLATDPDEDPTGSSGTTSITTTEDGEEDGTDPNGGTITETECGFFCTIGEFFEGLFS